jgi:hypothetical protein
MTIPVLYWPQRFSKRDLSSEALAKADADDYQAARKKICDDCGEMPTVIYEEPDISGFFKENPDAELFYPVFKNSYGWWGNLIGAEPKISGQIRVSGKLHLMRISAEGQANARKMLLVAEVFPTSAFFKKTIAGIATPQDMIATDSGTVIGLFSSNAPSNFRKAVETCGNFYLDCIGSV